MRCVVVDRPGGHERLRIEERPAPAPGPGEVLVAVSHAGVNYADVMVRMGLYASAKKYVGWPITPGFEVAGQVAAVGPGVRGWEVGQSCLAVTRFGGYTSHLVVPAHQVFALPAALSPAQAAAFPTVFLTAWYALYLCRPRVGERALVHSAAGGVGGALCQLLTRAGCRVTGVVSRPAKRVVAQAAGAQRVIVTQEEALWPAAEADSPEGFRMIFDANGVATLKQSWNHLAPPGRLVVYGFHTMLTRGKQRPSWPKLILGWLRTPRFNPLDMTGSNRSVLAFNLSYLFDEQVILEEAMAELLPGFADGTLRAPPITEVPLTQVAQAHANLESGTSVGKQVLVL